MIGENNYKDLPLFKEIDDLKNLSRRERNSLKRAAVAKFFLTIDELKEIAQAGDLTLIWGIGTLGEAHICAALGLPLPCWAEHPNTQTAAELQIRRASVDSLEAR